MVGNDPDLVLTAGDRALFTRVASEIEKMSEKGDRGAMSLLNPEVATDNSLVSAEQCHLLADEPSLVLSFAGQLVVDVAAHCCFIWSSGVGAPSGGHGGRPQRLECRRKGTPLLCRHLEA